MNNTGHNEPKKSTKMFVNGVLILTVSNILVKTIGLLFKIPLHAYLGDEGMGYFNAAYTIYTWFYMISTAGLPVAMSVLVSKSRAKGNFNQVKKILRLSLWLFFIIGSVGMLILALGSNLFATLIKVDKANLCILAIAPTLFFVCLTSAYRGYFQGHQIMWPTAVSQLIESVGKLVLGILFASWSIARGNPLHVTAAYTILGITIGVFCGMVFIWLAKLLYNTDAVNAEYALPDSYTMPTERTKKLLRELIVIAIPVTLSSSVMSLANLVDLVVVSRRLQDSGLSEAAAAALYGNYTTLAVPLFNLPPVLVYPIGYSLVPMLSALIVQKDTARLQRTMNSSLKVAAILSIPCAVGMAALAEPILLMIFGSKDGSAATAAPLLATLAVSSFLVSMLAITNSVLQAHKKEVLPLVSMLTGAAAKIVISYLLIGNPGIRMFGAPISTDICYVIVVLMNFFFCARYAGLKPDLIGVFVKPLLAAALCGGTAIGVYTLAESVIARQRIDTILAIAAAVVVYVIGILLSGCLCEEDFEFIPAGRKIYSILRRLHLIRAEKAA